MDCLFVGAGTIAYEYADALKPTSLSLTAVCDVDEERAGAFGKDYDVQWYTDLETALNAVEAPIVVNLTSHTAHAPVTRQALEANRHVYSQKPLALDSAQAEELLDLAQNRALGLRVAPENPHGPSQRRAARNIAEERLGNVQMAYAYAHVGRVTEWHDRPGSFLTTGPLYDGAVYPLTLLTSWFGPVATVRVADGFNVWPRDEAQSPSASSHIEATLEFEVGLNVRLTTSFYTPHRSREFYGLELHGDSGSLYLKDTGAMTTATDHVQFGRRGREYTIVPPQSPVTETKYSDAIEEFAKTIATVNHTYSTARRGAHVVAICNAIETAIDDGGPIDIPSFEMEVDRIPNSSIRPERTPRTGRQKSIRLPSVGFGCSRYRDGDYVDRDESIETALDAGYRFFDSAELYGNEHRIGSLLQEQGSPNREAIFLLGKVWRTNHRQEHMLKAARGSLDELGIDAFDSYSLHWPDAWEHRGPLDRLAEKPIERQEALTFPKDSDGTIEKADIPLERAYENLEKVYEEGLTRTLGVSNVTKPQLETILRVARIPPSIVQIERHPYLPQTELVSYCHEHGIRVVAHSPLSAPGLLEEPVLKDIADRYGVSPAGVVIAWNVAQGVVPIPSSTKESHVVSNLQAGSVELDTEALNRIDSLQSSEFQR